MQQGDCIRARSPQPINRRVDRDTPGFGPGRGYYLLVDDPGATIKRAAQAGGMKYMGRTKVGGYGSPMIRGPGRRLVGLSEAFGG